MDQLAIRTRIKFLFQRELKARGGDGISHYEFVNATGNDAGLNLADPDLLAYVQKDVWNTHGRHKIKIGALMVRAVIGARVNGEVRKFLAREATAGTWAARSELLSEVVEPIIKARDTAERVAEGKGRVGHAG